MTGFPVGVGGGEYKEQAVTLKPGDRLVLYSDGLTGVRNADGEHFGTRRLLAALDETRRLPLADALGRAGPGGRGVARGGAPAGRHLGPRGRADGPDAANHAAEATT